MVGNALAVKPWRNEGLRSVEEGMLRMTQEAAEKAARGYQAVTEVGM